jgi:hypothetical protein
MMADELDDDVDGRLVIATDDERMDCSSGAEASPEKAATTGEAAQAMLLDSKKTGTGLTAAMRKNATGFILILCKFYGHLN